MFKAKELTDTAEIKEMAEWLAVFQKLPEKERIAIQYYLKGRIDAVKNDIEIPLMAAASH